jgi:hypothetical protein
MQDRSRSWQPIEHVALDGLVGSEDEESALVALLERASLARQHRWLVDLRGVEPLDDPELLRVVEVVHRYAGALRKARAALLVAGDASRAERRRPERIAPFLPFTYRKFQDVEEAVRWLGGSSD